MTVKAFNTKSVLIEMSTLQQTDKPKNMPEVLLAARKALQPTPTRTLPRAREPPILMPLLRQIKPLLTRLMDTYKDLSLLEDVIMKWDAMLRVGSFIVF